MAGDMAFESARTDKAGGWATITALARADCSANHGSPQNLTHFRAPKRMVADAIHLIGMLHGRHPGIVDHAMTRAPDMATRQWLASAARHFADERSFLTRLVSAAGPIPSTPGQAETEAAVAAQRHALDMLAQSDRSGCAVGAAVAVVLDWRAIRAVLDASAERFGVVVPLCALPDTEAMAAMIGATSPAPAIERAMAFGAQQVLAQHRGLWDLIEARASARGDI